MNRYYIRHTATKNAGKTGPVYLCRETDTADGPLFCPTNEDDYCGEWCPFFEIKTLVPDGVPRLTISCRAIQRFFVLDAWESADEEV